MYGLCVWITPKQCLCIDLSIKFKKVQLIDHSLFPRGWPEAENINGKRKHEPNSKRECDLCEEWPSSCQLILRHMSWTPLVNGIFSNTDLKVKSNTCTSIRKQFSSLRLRCELCTDCTWDGGSWRRPGNFFRGASSLGFYIHKTGTEL